MMLAEISGKNGNIYYPGGHGPVPSNIEPPVPKATTIKKIGDNQLQVNWTWETSVLETIKSEAASTGTSEGYTHAHTHTHTHTRTRAESTNPPHVSQSLFEIDYKLCNRNVRLKCS